MSLLFSSGQIENPDTHLRLTQTRILLSSYSWQLPSDVGEDSHGNIAINADGSRYMVYNPGQSIVFLPVYFLAQQIISDEGDCYYSCAFLISFINFFIHAFSAFILFKILLLLGFNSRKANYSALIYCFTSYSFTLAQGTYEHHYEMIFVLLSFYSSLKKSKLNFFLSGLFLTAGILFRSTSILALPGILLLTYSNRQRIQILLGVIPGVVFILWYNYFRFSNPLESGYSLAWSLANGNDIHFWDLTRIPSSIFGLILSPAKGLIIFSPTILLSFLGLKKFYNSHKKITLAIAFIILPYLFIYSMNFAWHGSIWSFGPRYILPIVPFLFLPFVYVDITKSISIVLILGALSQILLCSVNYKRELLEQYMRFNGIDDNRYIYSMQNLPYLVQTKQLIKIIPKNFSGKLEDTFPDSPWKKEIRKTSSIGVLDYSIEKNSINFWWIRILHLNCMYYIKILSLLFSTLIILTCFYYAKRSN